MNIKYLLALAAVVLSAHVRADSWAPAKTAGLSSPTGQTVARIVPGSNLDGVYGFSGAKKGAVATAILYRLDSAVNYVKAREFSLLNPIAPVYAAVTDAGEIVTLDNWHNIGTGNSVVVVYSAEGQIVRKYGLTDIYTDAEMRKFERSVSSIWWRCPAQPTLDSRAGVLEFDDTLGASVEINLKTGEIKRNPTARTGC